MSDPLPESIESADQLEDMLSAPTQGVVDFFRRLDGRLLILGGGGKIGPSLVRMACRARTQAGTDQEIFAVDRFPDPATRKALDKAGAKTITCNLLDGDDLARLPDAENVIYMAGMKFGTTEKPWLTWAANALMPAYCALRFAAARIVAFSTGCVYAMVPVNSAGSVESDPLEPLGEYSNSCVARERVLEYCSAENGTKMVLLRLNYALDMRYGVLADIATGILTAGQVDVSMNCFNAVWQGDVNAAAILLLEHATAPPLALNFSGPEKNSIRQVAQKLADLMGRQVRFAGKEADMALHSDSSRAYELIGKPAVPIDRVIQWTAKWVAAGKHSLNKPTHYQTRDGKY